MIAGNAGMRTGLSHGLAAIVIARNAWNEDWKHREGHFSSRSATRSYLVMNLGLNHQTGSGAEAGLIFTNFRHA